VHQEFVLGFERLETAAGERGALRMLNRVLHGPLIVSQQLPVMTTIARL